MFKRFLTFGILVLVFLAGCSSPSPLPTPSLIPSPSPTVTKTFTPSPSLTPSLTPTPSITPTPTWAFHPPGEAIAPILLYHHVAEDNDSERYNVTPDQFAVQMQALDDWGYTAITITHLIQAITEGVELPPRPVVITFDDGHISIYENAFPIMEEYGFIGVTYIVANRLKAEGFTGVEELTEMAAAGWEVGSHSYTHADLSKFPDLVRYEALQSKLDLENALSVPINTFAYPFGGFTPLVGDRIQRYGYLGAVGLGVGSKHNIYMLYYLKRIEVQGTMDLERFAELLPWSEPPEGSQL